MKAFWSWLICSKLWWCLSTISHHHKPWSTTTIRRMLSDLEFRWWYSVWVFSNGNKSERSDRTWISSPYPMISISAIEQQVLIRLIDNWKGRIWKWVGWCRKKSSCLRWNCKSRVSNDFGYKRIISREVILLIVDRKMFRTSFDVLVLIQCFDVQIVFLTGYDQHGAFRMSYNGFSQ